MWGSVLESFIESVSYASEDDVLLKLRVWSSGFCRTGRDTCARKRGARNMNNLKAPGVFYVGCEEHYPKGPSIQYSYAYPKPIL